MNKSLVDRIPTDLAVSSVHPDYLEACIEACCTGLRYPSKLEPGTVTLLRRTTAGQAGRKYGVVGIWWFTGISEHLRPGQFRWPRRWAYRVKFSPLVHRFESPFCEMFTEPMPDHYATLRSSSKVPGLIYTSLQGSLVRVHDKTIAAKYVHALLEEKAEELTQEATYLGQTVRVDALLKAFAKKLESQAKSLVTAQA